eukprot:gene39018-4970_t
MLPAHSVALREREQRQREKNQRLQDAKRVQQEKSLTEQLQADEDRGATDPCAPPSSGDGS